MWSRSLLSQIQYCNNCNVCNSHSYCDHNYRNYPIYCVSHNICDCNHHKDHNYFNNQPSDFFKTLFLMVLIIVNGLILIWQQKLNPFHVNPSIKLKNWKVWWKSKRTSMNFQISHEVGANWHLEIQAAFVAFEVK